MSHALKSAQQSQSIQTLLEAEKEASKIVQQARQCEIVDCGRAREGYSF
jgi:V-type H+-transporting ATPase subunit G